MRQASLTVNRTLASKAGRSSKNYIPPPPLPYLPTCHYSPRHPWDSLCRTRSVQPPPHPCDSRGLSRSSSPAISAPGNLGTRENSVIPAPRTTGTREGLVVSASGTPLLGLLMTQSFQLLVRMPPRASPAPSQVSSGAGGWTGGWKKRGHHFRGKASRAHRDTREPCVGSVWPLGCRVEVERFMYDSIYLVRVLFRCAKEHSSGAYFCDEAEFHTVSSVV